MWAQAEQFEGLGLDGRRPRSDDDLGERIGAGARDDSGKIQPLDVKAGDRILFGKWSGTEVKLDGQDLLIMKESDILGVVS